MKLNKLPIPYIYCILIGILLGTILGTRFYWAYLVWGEAANFNWGRYFMAPFVNQALWGFLVPLVFYFYRKYPVVRNANWGIKSKAVLASIGVSWFHEIVSYIVWFVPLHYLGVEEFNDKTIDYIRGAMFAGFISQLVEYWIIYLIFVALDYFKRFNEKQTELVRMQSQLSNAQLTALRLQLQPHFLFNTLNTISALIDLDTKNAQKIVSKLGNLLRTVLDKDKPASVPLRDEIEFIKSYLGIEQARFHDRLEIQYHIDDKALDALVPSLILQPLVENAIKHGFSKHSHDGIVSVSAQKLPTGQIELRVKDDGQGSSQSLEKLRTQGIGLKNVQERLELIYRQNYTFELKTEKELGFEVKILIPFTWFPEAR